ncbi:MAG: pyridoxal phosphate-dependent aminotransferase [bacterium]
MHISKRLSALKPSATLAVTAKARELQAQGRDVIALAAGEPDFPPPDHVREAVAAEARQGITRYGPAPGGLEVREAIASQLQEVRGVEYTPDQVVLTNGGKHALFNTMAALLDPGDEVLIPAPYWVTYPAQVELLDGVVRIVMAEDVQGFKVTPRQLDESMTDRTRCVLFNNPSNPTGALYSPDEVRAFTEVCVERGVVIVSDEVYDSITYGEAEYLSPASVSPEAAENTVLINSLSKSYAMPGWRIGYLAGPAAWTKKVTSFQGQATHHPSALAQAAALAAYTGSREKVEEMREAFRQRRDFLLEAFEGIPGFQVAVPPQGAFYLFPRITDLIDSVDGVSDDVEACTWLLEQTGVALVPGSAFGAPGYLRLSYAASMEDLEEAVERIGETMGGLDQ